MQSPAKSNAASPGLADSITQTIERALSSAGLKTRSGPLTGITHTIEKALSDAGLQPSADAPTPGGPLERAASPAPAQRGQLISRSFTNGAGTRAYKLYVPQSYSTDGSNEVPMVVMLHGCTQSPDDFAAGTQMNALAEQHGFVVVYPAQAVKANGAKCWNWFRAEDQSGGGGEPAILAGIAHEVAGEFRIDRRRIYVAGLSAGAAMAVILGATHPELFAAVGAHSGLPYAAAHDVSSAFSAMKSGPAPAGFSARARTQQLGVRYSVPTIVFHGDADSTVAPSNGAAIVESMVGVTNQPVRVSTHDGAVPGGRTYQRTV